MAWHGTAWHDMMGGEMAAWQHDGTAWHGGMMV
jgi:hypothetical protein